MRTALAAVVIITGAVGIAAAQRPAASPTPARAMRILPLGDPPPFLQEVRDGVRYELPPPPGSVPPREVQVTPGADAAPAVRLSLGMPSAPVDIPAGAGPLVLRRPTDSADARPWLALERPESGSFLVVAWRDPQAATWDRARAMVVPDSPAAAPAGSVTILNVAPVAVALVLGGESQEKIALAPGRPLARRLGPGTLLPIQAAVADASGTLKRFLSQTLEQSAVERTWVVFHRADGLQPRDPVKVWIQREIAPAAGNR